jgi:hypothetical protein
MRDLNVQLFSRDSNLWVRLSYDSGIEMEIKLNQFSEAHAELMERIGPNKGNNLETKFTIDTDGNLVFEI